MSAPILSVCDLAVDALAAGVCVGLAEVSREYVAPVKLEKFTGRHVWVFPAKFAEAPGTRGEDQREHLVALVIAELYPEQGTPPKDWLDERVNFVAEIWDALTDPRAMPAAMRHLWPQQAELSIYDLSDLVERKLFWSEVEITYREIAG